MIQLYHNDMSSCAQKVRIVLAEKGLEWKGHHLSLRDGESRTSEYKKLNPNGVVPTLITDSNETIIESTVIMEYLDEKYQVYLLGVFYFIIFQKLNMKIYWIRIAQNF